MTTPIIFISHELTGSQSQATSTDWLPQLHDKVFFISCRSICIDKNCMPIQSFRHRYTHDCAWILILPSLCAESIHRRYTARFRCFPTYQRLLFSTIMFDNYRVAEGIHGEWSSLLPSVWLCDRLDSLLSRSNCSSRDEAWSCCYVRWNKQLSCRRIWGQESTVWRMAANTSRRMDEIERNLQLWLG